MSIQSSVNKLIGSAESIKQDSVLQVKANAKKLDKSVSKMQDSIKQLQEKQKARTIQSQAVAQKKLDYMTIGNEHITDPALINKLKEKMNNGK